ncbi:MAG TPA: FAD-dependent oxidoreductase [Hyphomicrobiaceae bacterium]|nr:FAD-dependent oxidoreductase [Hyphomicrobiaceae bacterium]
MADDKSESGKRLFFTSEIFKDGPRAGGNLSDTIGAEQGLEMFGGDARGRRRERPARTHLEPAREIPVFAETDVLVVGGGPAGTAAAIAAGRLGADVLLVERYNHLGGLSTGGLVIWIDRMTDWSGRHVIRGIANELMERLPHDAIQGPKRADWGSRDAATAAYWAQRTAAYHGIVTWSPTIDPEALKTLSMQMVAEAKVRLLLHAWAVAPILEGSRVQGAIFESKEGRHAIYAKVVIDTTGDADLIARTHASFESDIDEGDIHHCMNTAFLLGGIDMETWLAFRRQQPDRFSEFMAKGRQKLKFFEKPFVSWRNDVALFMGPRLAGYSAVDVEDLTSVELRSRQLAVGHLEMYRAAAPGFANAFLMLGGPQIGVRHSRRLNGLGKVTRQQWDTGHVWDDEIGVSTSLSPKFPNISVPYGALVPAELDNILGAGRHVACDASSHTFLREIPQCWLTGQAAGIAAALAANTDKPPREVPASAIQLELLRQGAYLSPSVEAALRPASAAE